MVNFGLITAEICWRVCMVACICHIFFCHNTLFFSKNIVLWQVCHNTLLFESQQSIPSTCFHNIANFGPLTAEIGLPLWGTLANFNGFRVLAALLHGTPVVGPLWASAKLCGVEQWAPPIFGRATIALGIGLQF